MAAKVYKAITSETQYYKYEEIVEELVIYCGEDQEKKNEILLVQSLLTDWNRKCKTPTPPGPIVYLKSLLKEDKMHPNDLVEILQVSKQYISDMLNYKIRLSNDVARDLGLHFNVAGARFTRPYKLRAKKKQL